MGQKLCLPSVVYQCGGFGEDDYVVDVVVRIMWKVKRDVVFSHNCYNSKNVKKLYDIYTKLRLFQHKGKNKVQNATDTVYHLCPR